MTDTHRCLRQYERATIIANCSWTSHRHVSCEEGSCERQAMNSGRLVFVFSLKPLDDRFDHMGIQSSLEIGFAPHWSILHRSKWSGKPQCHDKNEAEENNQEVTHASSYMYYTRV